MSYPSQPQAYAKVGLPGLLGQQVGVNLQGPGREEAGNKCDMPTLPKSRHINNDGGRCSGLGAEPYGMKLILP